MIKLRRGMFVKIKDYLLYEKNIDMTESEYRESMRVGDLLKGKIVKIKDINNEGEYCKIVLDGAIFLCNINWIDCIMLEEPFELPYHILVPGYTVELRNGDKLIYVGDSFYSYKDDNFVMEFCGFEFNNYLECTRIGYYGHDIDKIYNNNELIWERK